MKKFALFSKYINSKVIWLPPFLFSIIPILAVYVHNINFIGPERIVLPLLYSFAFTVLSGCVAYTIFKNKEKASVFTSIWVILFFSFGYILLILGENKVIAAIPISLNKLLFGLYAIVLVAIFRFLLKSKSLEKTITLLFLVATTIATLNLVKIVPFEINRWLDGRKLNQYVSGNLGQITVPNEADLKPDIYYFIFDRYGRQDVLEKHFDFQNRSHIEFLQSNGFWVGHESYANYPKTFLSLSSSLNITYLDFLTPILGDKQGDQVNVYRQLLQDNQMARFLKSQGYKYVLYGSSWDPLQEKGIADENYNLLADFDEFHLYVYERTLLNSVRGVIENKQLFTGTERFNKISLNLDYRLHRINRQKDQPQPLFVFGHFLLPHPPYVFSPDCDPYSLSTSSQQIPEDGYLNEVQCANNIMKSLISEIQSRQNRPAVVIFQSDEGPYLPLSYFNDNGESVPENSESYFIHSAILNALYLPNKEDPSKPVDYAKMGLSPNLSPLNTFRTILNYYFGTNLPILENKTYFSLNDDRVYDFKDITDSINSGNRF
ncbi:MAG: sulfatase-like hydrolase/transferase [Candidatus Curtissbacteria bacterium]|nr:sulfatase-like hydrolase/transferase [Candidatus Curtissbacteria bacterium]